MQLPLRLTPFVLGGLLLAGCAAPAGPRAFAPGLGQRQPTAATTSSAATTSTAVASPATGSTGAPVATTTAGGGGAAAAAAAAGTSGTAAADAAIKAVIQKANDEQAQAFAAHDPSVMRDTATAGYYDQLVQIASDMEKAGVGAIKLAKLEWGPISVQGTGAQATTYETWLTTLADGSTQQDRERNVYTLVQEGGAWKVQADDHPDANLDQSSGGAGVSPSPVLPQPGVVPAAPGLPGAAPVPALPGATTGVGQSHNWSGYAATGGTYTAVSGTWTVPQVTANGGFASDATWVGIGGVNTRDLIQAGTDATVQGSGVQYTAWVETLPQASHQVALNVSPGDTVSVAIGQQQDGTWLITFQDKTSGQRYQTTETYNSSRSSAEWVEEAPAGGRRVLPLDNFGTVTFSAGSAVKDGKQVSIAQAGATPITMIDGSGQPIARPSGLSADGAGFSVSRLADSPAAAPGFGQSPFGQGGPGYGGRGYGRSPYGRPRGGSGAGF